MSIVALLGIIIGFFVDRSDPGPEWIPTEFLSRFGLTIFVPLVSLVVASATLGNLREERTLAYFWLRPIGRWQISLAAFVSGLAVLLPLVLIPMLVLGAIIGDGADIRGIFFGSLVGAIGYAAVFTLLGLLTQRALAWGLVYILVWEGFVANLSQAAGRFALRTYSTSTLGEIADSPDLLGSTVAVSTAVIVTAAVAIGCLVLTTMRLNTMDVD